MDVRDEVLSIEQAKELMKLGIDLNKIYTTFIYKKITDCYGKENYELMYFDGISEMFEAGDIATLTSDEMLDMIDDSFIPTIIKDGHNYAVCLDYDNVGNRIYGTSFKATLKDALFEAIKYCKKNNLLKI